MKISAIIPVYNAEKYIKKCIDSVIVQTYKNWEIIAVDDGSKDNSYTIIQKYSAIDDRIKVIKKDNEGPGLTRNKGMELAEGDYYVFLDSDDYIEKDYFELLNNEVSKNNSDVIFIDAIQEMPDGSIIRYERMSDYAHLSRADLIGVQMTGKMPWGGWRKAVSANLVKSHHLTYTSDPVGEEAVFSFDLLHYASCVSFIPKSLYHYVNHPNSQSKRPDASWAKTYEKVKEHVMSIGYEEEYKEALNSFAYRAFLSWLIRNCSGMRYRAIMDDANKRIDVIEKETKWNINKSYLNKQSLFLLPLVRRRILLPVIIAINLRK